MAAYLKHISSKSLADPLKQCRRAEETSDCEEGTKPACASDEGERLLSLMSCWPPSAVVVVGFVVLTANCGAAVYHLRNDPWSAAFVLASFLVLVSLFYALRVFETLPPRESSPRRARVKAAVWVMSTALTLMFSRRVAALMPSFPAAVLVWVMAVSTISAGFYMFFVCPDGAAAAEEEPPAKVSDVP